MGDDIGDVLRLLREAAGLSLGAVASKVYCDKSLLSRIETGSRKASPDMIGRCDDLFGTTPMLTMLLELEDNMKRRVLISGITAAAGTAGLAGAAALAEAVRHGLLDAAGDTEDWDQVVAEYSRRLATDPSPEYGTALQAQLMVARQQLLERGKTPERLRAVAELGQLYGLWRGNQGDIATARGWYRTATTLADRSGHTPTRMYTRARSASRGIYEGFTVRETVDGANEALALSSAATTGAVEAYSALVHVHALTGRIDEGRRALGGMRDAAEKLPDEVAGPVQRTASFRNYLECRIGPLKEATAAHDEARLLLRPVPVWRVEADVYYGRALVRAGDVTTGVDFALDAMRTLPHDNRVVALGVRDLLSVVPAGYRTDEVDELRTYAADEPGPWETLS